MSEEKQKLDEARRLWDNAIEALEKLSYVNEETLREIAKTRTRIPVIVFGQKGRTKKGITVAEYTKDLGLGSELPVKADLPNGGLKAFFGSTNLPSSLEMGILAISGRSSDRS